VSSLATKFILVALTAFQMLDSGLLRGSDKAGNEKPWSSAQLDYFANPKGGIEVQISYVGDEELLRLKYLTHLQELPSEAPSLVELQQSIDALVSAVWAKRGQVSEYLVLEGWKPWENVSCEAARSHWIESITKDSVIATIVLRAMLQAHGKGFSVAGLRQMLGKLSAAVWVDGDVLHVRDYRYWPVRMASSGLVLDYEIGPSYAITALRQVHQDKTEYVSWSRAMSDVPSPAGYKDLPGILKRDFTRRARVAAEKAARVIWLNTPPVYGIIPAKGPDGIFIK
jgi:hypothetical protein